MRTLYPVSLLILALLIPRPLQARWESAHDNKSSIALAGMTNEQLFNEAFDVCVRRALLESLPNAADEARPALAECNDYLNTVYPFVRERNGGKVPPWMSELVTAHSTKECQRAFRTFLGSTERPAPEGKGDGGEVAQQPRPKKHKAPTPQPEWNEQLPPWLAPK